MKLGVLFLTVIIILAVAGGVAVLNKRPDSRRVNMAPPIPIPPVESEASYGIAPVSDAPSPDEPIAVVLDGVDENGWKTLRSDLFGFEIKFPGEWGIILPTYPITRAELSQSAIGDNVFAVSFSQPDWEKDTLLTFDVTKISVYEKNQMFINSDVTSGIIDNYTYEDVMVGNAHGFKRTNKQNGKNIIILGNDTYTFRFSGIDSFPGNREAYERMLPTFRLLP